MKYKDTCSGHLYTAVYQKPIKSIICRHNTGAIQRLAMRSPSPRILKYHRAPYPSESNNTLIEEIIIPLFSGNATEEKSCICIPISPKPRYINSADRQAVTKITKSLTEDAISIVFTDGEGDVTGCLTRNTARLKFVRDSSDLLMDLLKTDRIFSFERDDGGKIAGCSSVDEVVMYERGKCGKAIGCLTTDKIFTFERDEAGYIVRFTVEYLRDGDKNSTGLSSINKEFVFYRGSDGQIEGCVEKVGPVDVGGRWKHSAV